MSASVIGNRSLPAHEIRKYRQTHGTQDNPGTGSPSNRV